MKCNTMKQFFFIKTGLHVLIINKQLNCCKYSAVTSAPESTLDSITAYKHGYDTVYKMTFIRTYAQSLEIIRLVCYI